VVARLWARWCMRFRACWFSLIFWDDLGLCAVAEWGLTVAAMPDGHST